MKFPVIGFWLKTSKPLNTIEVYQYFSHFIKEKYEKKCVFNSIAKIKYFYFINVASNSNKMESFLVSWTERPSTQKSYQFDRTLKKIEINWGHETQKTKKI